MGHLFSVFKWSSCHIVTAWNSTREASSIYWFPSIHFTVPQPVDEPRTLWWQFTNELAGGLQASYWPLYQAPERKRNVSVIISSYYSHMHLSYTMLFKLWLFFFPLRFRTPNIRRSILESNPHTPTPFRSTLALQEAKYGPLKLLVRGLKFDWVLISSH